MRIAILLIAFITCANLLFGQAVHRVNSANDVSDGTCNAAHCSLREAIEVSNSNNGPDSIAFAIPGPGPHIIAVSTPLPAITDSFTVIDGTSQPGNNPVAGLIVIDGSALSGPAEHGLVIYTRHTKIYGLQIQDFPGDGIQIFGGFIDDPFISNLVLGAPDKGNIIINNGAYGIEGPINRNVSIKGNFIGTDLFFSPGLGNGWDGLFVSVLSGANVQIGDPAGGRNFLCSNNYSGLKIDLTNAAALTGTFAIRGNFIGTDPSRMEQLGNLGNTFGGSQAGGGIFLIGDGALTIGGAGPFENTIAYNYEGIYHDSDNRKTFNRNVWFCNTNGGVNLSGGANDDITTPYSVCVNNGALEGFADPNVQIDIYRADMSGCPPGTPCQGTIWLGSTMSDATGFWSYNIALPGGTMLTAIATDPQGNTSEFSECARYVSVMVTNDGPKCDGDPIIIEAIVDGDVTGATFHWIGPLGFDEFGQQLQAPSEGDYCLIVDFGTCVYDTLCTFVDYNPVTTETITDFCLGDSWTVNGNTYDENNTTGTEIIAGGNQYGCDSVINFNLQFNETIEGSIIAPEYACVGDTVWAMAEILISFGPYDFIYSDGVNPPDTLFDIFNGHMFPVVATQELYLQVLDINNNLTICDPIIGPTDTVRVSELAVDGMTSDYNGYGVSCPGAEDGEIILSVTGALGDVEYEWNNITYDGDMLFDLPDGFYSVTVTDETGCSVVWDTVLTEPVGPEPSYAVYEPSCINASDGIIIIDTVYNVSGQLMLSTDSVNFEPVSGYPIVVDTLSSGIRKLFFQDDGDCIIRLRFIVPRGDATSLDAGGTVSITAGDSIQLGFTSDIVGPAINWSPAEYLSCSMCPAPYASPPVSTYFTVSLLNEQGCYAIDSVLVQVFLPKRVFIPNVFSPNGDGNNDLFLITANQYGERIESIIVVERGGSTVFSGSDLPVNDPSTAWDGSFKGKLLNPGVYTYLIKVRFLDGQVVPFSGTVTLIR